MGLSNPRKLRGGTFSNVQAVFSTNAIPVYPIPHALLERDLDILPIKKRDLLFLSPGLPRMETTIEMTLRDFGGKVIKGDTTSTWLFKDALGTQHCDVKLPKGAHPRDHPEKPRGGVLRDSQARVSGDNQYQLPDMLVNIPDDSNSHPLSPSSGCPNHPAQRQTIPPVLVSLDCRNKDLKLKTKEIR